MKSRLVKNLLRLLLVLLCFPVVGFILGWTLIILYGLGIFPFPPLEKAEYEIVLSNGGQLRQTGVEQRGWGSNGYSWEMKYLPPLGAEPELVGEWLGSGSVSAWFTNGLIVVRQDTKTLRVRTLSGKWKHFSLKLPSPYSPYDMERLDSYARWMGLSVQEIQTLLSEVKAKNFSPSLYIKQFQPQTRELVLNYYAGPTEEEKRQVVLILSDDGSRFSLSTDVSPQRSLHD